MDEGVKCLRVTVVWEFEYLIRRLLSRVTLPSL